MDPCPDGAQQCCAPATEWRRRDKPAATKARQKSTAPAREGMGPCPDGAQQCRARATEWRRRDKPAATNARQKSTASNRMKMAGSTRRYKGKTEEHSDPPASLGTGEWLCHKNQNQQAKRDSSRENRAKLSFSSKSWRRMPPTAVPLSCCHTSDTSLCPYRVL